MPPSAMLMPCRRHVTTLFDAAYAYAYLLFYADAVPMITLLLPCRCHYRYGTCQRRMRRQATGIVILCCLARACSSR